MNVGAIHLCSFEAIDEIKGLHGKRRLHGAAADRVYDALKRAVIQAGRFSVFESTASQRAAFLFTRLHKDPDLEITPEGYPWTSVTLRKTP